MADPVDIYPGSDFLPSRLPDLNCLHPGSRKQTKKCLLSSSNYLPRCSSRIPHTGVKKGHNPGSRIRNTAGTNSKMAWLLDTDGKIRRSIAVPEFESVCGVGAGGEGGNNQNPGPNPLDEQSSKPNPIMARIKILVQS